MHPQRILFSIPVHEEPEVVVEQIENVSRYVPNSHIILHINPTFVTFESDLIRAFENVTINPSAHQFEWGQSLLRIHHSNYAYAMDSDIEFDYVSLLSSNQMFIRRGLETWVSMFDMGIQQLPCKKVYRNKLGALEPVKRWCRSVGVEKLYKGHWEGVFFRREIFHQIHGSVTNFFGVESLPIHLEEFVYASLGDVFNNERIASPHCYMEIGINKGLTPLTEEVIEKIRTQDSTISLYGKCQADRLFGFPRKAHIYKSVEHLFSVKRVPRRMDDPLRGYIRQLG